jgi:hypothetical protein
MTINTVGTLNLSTQFGALFVFFAFIETLEFFFQEIRPPFSMLNAKRFEIVYVHHVYKRLKHDLFHISPGIIPRR